MQISIPSLQVRGVLSSSVTLMLHSMGCSECNIIYSNNYINKKIINTLQINTTDDMIFTASHNEKIKHGKVAVIWNIRSL